MFIRIQNLRLHNNELVFEQEKLLNCDHIAAFSEEQVGNFTFYHITMCWGGGYLVDVESYRRALAALGVSDRAPLPKPWLGK